MSGQVIDKVPETVHDLAAYWSWTEDYVGFKLHGGSVVWEDAEYRPNGSLRIARIEPTEDGKHLRVMKRYVDPDTKITLVPNKEQQ